MPESQASRAQDQADAIARQKAHEEWAAQCNALGHPPRDANGDEIPDPLEQ
jgi:hypothetical protein